MGDLEETMPNLPVKVLNVPVPTSLTAGASVNVMNMEKIVAYYGNADGSGDGSGSTVQLQGSLDGLNWFNVGSEWTQRGYMNVNLIYDNMAYMRAKTTAHSSGTPSLTLIGNEKPRDNVPLIAKMEVPTSETAGAAVDVSGYDKLFIQYGTESGTLVSADATVQLQGSADGINWVNVHDPMTFIQFMNIQDFIENFIYLRANVTSYVSGTPRMIVMGSYKNTNI